MICVVKQENITHLSSTSIVFGGSFTSGFSVTVDHVTSSALLVGVLIGLDIAVSLVLPCSGLSKT